MPSRIVDRDSEGMMLQGTTDDLAAQLLQIARDPDLRGRIYEQLGDYCHQCRNRLNSLKLGLYLAMRQSPSSDPGLWSEIDRHYQQLERRVEQAQMLCRPMSLSRVTLAIDLLIDDRREAWTRAMASEARTLEFVAPAERAVASFDVERLGQTLDLLVAWRAAARDSTSSARVRWWAEAGYAHIVWEESPSATVSEVGRIRDEPQTWALPLLTRVALAHEGEIRVETEPAWKLEVLWPSSPCSS